jgi:phosphoribosylformylglycinamidine (FGAM) synthase-like amidotransferase family enzyme|nr:MAG TPA: hypothetical protein [Caudoviricetes sp.]
METKDKINGFLTKIRDLEESIKDKTNELNEAIVEYQDYLTELFKSNKISRINADWFATNFCRFSEEYGEYITEYNHDDVLTFFIEHKDGRISQLFDFKISTMIKEDGYCNYNFKDFMLKRITTNLENNGSNSKIYYMSDIDGDITEIVFNDNQRKYYGV